ncbi:hypothetical protein ACWFZ6_08010 [Methylorubrum extorquens]
MRLGLDDELCRLLGRAGLGEDAVTAVRFRGSGRESGVIVPTHRTWDRSRLRALAFEVACRALHDERDVLVVPPAEVEREPRLTNARRIFGAKEVPAYGDASALVRCIALRGGEATLADCEAALAGPFARKRIFGLVFGGHVEIDLSTELAEQTLVRLRSQDWTFGWNALGWRSIDTTCRGRPWDASTEAHRPA